MNPVRKLMKNIYYNKLLVFEKESWFVAPTFNLIF